MAPEILDRFDSQAISAAEIVHEQTHNRRIIILYPRHRQHTTLVALLHKFYAERMFFYTLIQDVDTNLQTMLWNLSHDAMFPIGFGQATRHAILTSDAPDDWAEAFGQDVAGLNIDDPFMIMLDNFDVLPREDDISQELFVALAQHLPSNAQIIINGKELRRQLWANLIKQGYVAALGDDETLGSGIFKEQALRGKLEVYALSGGSRVIIDGRPIIAWEGSLPRNLFYFFVDKPMVTRSEVFEAFWPKLQIKEATNVFHVTKRKISEKLGYDLTSYENGFYTPNNRLDRLYDVEVFIDHAEAALSTNDEKVAEENWFKAIEIYRGQFLKEVQMEWAHERREELRDFYVQSLVGLGRIYHNQGLLEQALGYMIRATGERPDREDIFRDVMQINSELGNKEAVGQQYQLLETFLKNNLNISPSQETKDLFKKLS